MHGPVCLPNGILIWGPFPTQLKQGKSARYCLPTSSTGRVGMWVDASPGENHVPSKGIRQPTQAADIQNGQGPTAHRNPFHTQPAPFFQWDRQGFDLHLSPPILCLALGTTQSRHRHHQPHLRGTRDLQVAHVWFQRVICSLGARPIIFVLQAIIPLDYKELDSSFFPINWKQIDDFWLCQGHILTYVVQKSWVGNQE